MEENNKRQNRNNKIKEAYAKSSAIIKNIFHIVKSRTYEESLVIIKNFFYKVRNQKFIKAFVTVICNGLGDSNKSGNGASWVNVVTMITSILGFAAYCVVSPVLAEYQRVKGIRIFSMIAIVVIIVVILRELVYLVGYEKIENLGTYFYKLCMSAWIFCQQYVIPGILLKMLQRVFARLIIWLVLFCEGSGIIFNRFKGRVCNWTIHHPRRAKCVVLCLLVVLSVRLVCFHPKTTYCTSVVEKYGMPVQSGEELEDKEQRDHCAAYWKIEDYFWRNLLVLTYVEPYEQLEVMKENSTAYGMLLFQPAAKIEIKYKRDRSKYLSLNQRAFEVAKDNGFREPEYIAYYNSNEKLVLELKKNTYGKFDIISYSSTDMPQLLNSTLLYTKNQENMENSMTSRQIEVTYNAEGLPETRRLSPNIYNENGINGEYYVYDQNGRLTTLYYLDINGEFVCNKQGIMMIDFQYEDNGNLHSIRYYGGEDREEKTEGYQSVFCERFSYDSYGNLKERSQRDRNENLCSDSNGVCIYRYSYNYDTKCTLEKEEFLGFDRESVRDNKFHSTLVTFAVHDGNENEMKGRKISISLDKVGSSVEAVDGQADSVLLSEPKNVLGTENQRIQVIAFLNQDNQKNDSVAGLDSDSDADQEQIDDTALSKQDVGQYNKTIYTEQSDGETDWNSLASKGSKVDVQEKIWNRGNIAEVTLEEEADIIRHYTVIQYLIDEKGCVTEKRYCDNEDKLVACEEGYAAMCLEYDDQKRLIYERYLDRSSSSCNSRGGYAVVRTNYESKKGNQIASVEYLLEDEKPVRNRELGYATVRYIRTDDDNNKLVQKQYLDEKGKPARLPKLGYSMVEEYYDERNFLIWEAYYDERDGKYEKTCRDDYGVAGIWYEYDDSGNRICALYKDVNNQLVNRSDRGYAAVHWQYEGGYMTGCYYEGNQDQMLVHAVDRKTGIAGIQYTYESGKKVREEYYDMEGNPSFRTDIGCVAMAFEYNNRGGKSAESYYGLEGEAVLRKDTGYAMATYQDDEFGRCISVRFYDTEKQLVISLEDQCAGYDYTYDEQGNEESVKYIGLDGKPMVRKDLGYAQTYYRYDADGNVTEGRHLDVEGKPAVRKGRGYTYYTSEYDEHGNWLGSCYYKDERTPVLRQDEGYFRIENEYDSDGQRTSQKFYGTDDKPIISTEYYCAGFQWEYEEAPDENFVFQYEGNEKGKKRIATFIDRDGEPLVRRDLGYAKVESVYDIEDREISAVFYDADGNMTVRKEGGYAAFRDVYENGDCVESRYYDVNGNLVKRSDNGYAVVKNTYDTYHQRIQESYYDENEKPTISTKYHCAGFQYEFDAKGNKTHVKYLDEKNQMMVRVDLGYAQVTIGYDHNGNQVSEAYFDTEGRAVARKEGGYASYRDEYDGTKWMETRYYDKRGRLTLHSERGYAVVKNTYDMYGQMIEQTYYGASDVLKPVISKKHHCAGYRHKYDEMGNQVYTSYLDLDGNLMTRNDLGYAQVKTEYDSIGNVKRESYYDIWGNPAIDKEGGYSYYKKQYDEKGRVKEIAYYIDRNVNKRIHIAYEQAKQSVEEGEDSIDESGIGENGQEEVLVLRKDNGYAREEFTYDDYGQEIRCWYYGTDGEAVISTKYSCAGFEYAYDERGNQTNMYYLGLEREHFVRRDLGIAHIQEEYDVSGNLKKKLYFNLDGPAPYYKYGYSSYENDFQDGRIVMTRYLNETGELVINGEKGCAAVQYQYDKLGQCIAELYYGTNMEPMISQQNYCAGCYYEYDERGNRIKKSYVNTDGNLMIRRDLGYAMIRSDYDDCGQETRTFYYDVDEKPAIWKKAGNSSCEYVYDKGNCVERRYYDRNGNAVPRWDTGYAIIQYEYDVYGQCVAESYYDTEGKPVFSTDYQCAGRQFGFDERGNQTEFRCIGLDGKPMIWGDLGYAQIVCEFDRFNNETKEIYLDTDKNPIVRPDLGYAQTQWEYDEMGRMKKEAYFDEAGQPVLRKERGYAYFIFLYDDENGAVQKHFYDLDDKLIICKEEGAALVRHFYNELGQDIKVDYWDEDEDENMKNMVNQENHCSNIEYRYDERGNQTRILYWNTVAKTAEFRDTEIYIECITYDAYGNVIERAYYKPDPNDPENEAYWQPHVRKDLRYARVNYLYEENILIKTEYRDEEDEYTAPEGIGYAFCIYEYDDIWQLSRKSYYGVDEELGNYGDRGAATIEYSYNYLGNISDTAYYDKMGNRI